MGVRNRIRALEDAAWDFVLRRPFLVAVFSGGGATATVLVAGLLLRKAHGNGWPWWFHGTVIALVTGLLAGLFTRVHIREVKRREARLLAGERMSHEVCNALQVLVGRTYLHPGQRPQLEDEAIERIRNGVRELLPNVLEIPVRQRPVSPPAYRRHRFPRL